MLFKDKEQAKNIVVVGNWNAEEHIEWSKKNIARFYQLKDSGVQKVKYAVILHGSAIKTKPFLIHVYLFFFFLYLCAGWSPISTAMATCVIWLENPAKSLSN